MLSVFRRRAAAGPSTAKREHKIAAVVAYSQSGTLRKSDRSRSEAAVRFESYLRSRPAQFLEDLYESLPRGSKGGRRG